MYDYEYDTNYDYDYENDSDYNYGYGYDYENEYKNADAYVSDMLSLITTIATIIGIILFIIGILFKNFENNADITNTIMLIIGTEKTGLKDIELKLNFKLNCSIKITCIK